MQVGAIQWPVICSSLVFRIVPGSDALRRCFDDSNGHLQLLVSPRDSHENLPAIGGGTQVADFCRGKTKGIFQKNLEL